MRNRRRCMLRHQPPRGAIIQRRNAACKRPLLAFRLGIRHHSHSDDVPQGEPTHQPSRILCPDGLGTALPGIVAYTLYELQADGRRRCLYHIVRLSGPYGRHNGSVFQRAADIHHHSVHCALVHRRAAPLLEPRRDAPVGDRHRACAHICPHLRYIHHRNEPRKAQYVVV